MKTPRLIAIAALVLIANACGKVRYASCPEDAATCEVDAACVGPSCSATVDGRPADARPTDTSMTADTAPPSDVMPTADADCEGDACAPLCPEPQRSCSGACVDVTSDGKNCGTCGKTCQMGEACRAGVCTVVCPPGQDACGGPRCLDLRSEAKNCGACGRTCADSEDCVAGACKTACRAGLRQPLTDAWGTRWDGLERAPEPHAASVLSCAAIGGRLPTATELHRVSATESATVGQTTNTNFLWSANPRGATQRMIVRLSDGVPGVSDATAARLNYRCICPAPEPVAFTGTACHGDPKAPCFALGKRHNMDSRDRAPLPKTSAMWECAQSHGQLADSLTYVEAIEQALPNGSSKWLHTADDGSYTSDIIVKWQNTQPIWMAPGNVSVGATTDLRPFRCVGLNHDPGANPRAIPNEFKARTFPWKSDGADNAAAAWAAAHDVCWARGGHVPRSTELGAMIMQGLPGGSGVALWTADQAGYNGSSFLTHTLSWMGVAENFRYFFTGIGAEGVSWTYKTDPARPYRCLYYPIDPAFTAPEEAACSGGCFKLAAPGAPATMWFDGADRPAATFESAVKTCTARGGHLPSERDFTEAVRRGLPGGTGQRLYTWDVGYGAGATAQIAVQVVFWTGVDPLFSGLYPRNSTWLPFGGSSPYRCMWTNELR